MTSAAPRTTVFAEPWQKFIDEFGGAPLLSGTVEEMMQQWDVLGQKLMSKYKFPAPDTSVETEQINLQNCWVRVYKTSSTTAEDPVAVFIHGGGWCMGSVDGEDAISRILSKACNMTVVAVEYRLAPKHKFPAALDDCVEASLWTLQHFQKDKITLIGGSAGANLAFGAALRLIDEGKGDAVAGVAGMVPVTVHPEAVPPELKSRYTAYEEHAENTVNTKAAMKSFIDGYGAPPDDKYTSCLLHPRLKDLSKVYMTESGTDTLRDDARLMKEKLESEGVAVRYDAYPGYPHYSWTFPSEELSEHSAEFFGKLTNGVNWIAKSGRVKL